MAIFAIRLWAAKVTFALTALLVIFFASKLGMQWYKVQVEREQIRVGITFDQAKAIMGEPRTELESGGFELLDRAGTPLEIENAESQEGVLVTKPETRERHCTWVRIDMPTVEVHFIGGKATNVVFGD